MMQYYYGTRSITAVAEVNGIKAKYKNTALISIMYLVALHNDEAIFCKHVIATGEVLAIPDSLMYRYINIIISTFSVDIISSVSNDKYGQYW